MRLSKHVSVKEWQQTRGMQACGGCGKKGGMAFECIECCVRWLSKMTREEMQINAPVIENVMGAEHMQKVRDAWRDRK